MPTKPQVLKRRLAASSRIFRVEELEVHFANGEIRQYERLLSNHQAVIIVAMPSVDEVLLVREYAAGLDSYQWALPKGKVDPGEDFLAAANRELTEEAGFAARRLTLLKYLTQSPNYMQHGTQIVLAEDLYPAQAQGDEPEPLAVEAWPMAELDRLAAREDFSEARSLAALYLAQAHLAARGR